jgi:PKD repeat protein
MRLAVLALAAVLVSCLLGAGSALAQSGDTTVIDAVDVGGPHWEPANVTVDVGDTVRWEYDQAQAPHNVKSTSENWSYTGEVKSPGGPPDSYTFTTPGLYTFLCQVHPEMTGSVTVEGAEPSDPLENVLVFSKTAGFRHSSIPAGIAALEQLGAQNDFNVDATEDATQFTDANLAQYDAVVFLSTTGDVLNTEQQNAFERYLQAGNGYVGIHAAADTEYQWPWYGEMLGGYFRNHPPGTPTATVNVEDGDEPSTEGLPTAWTRTDEWYNYQSPVNPSVGGGGADYSPRASVGKVLATVDESTYEEQDGSEAADDHPISWCSDFDGGHVWYTGMGHTEASFGEAGFLQHILGGLQTVTGAEAADCGEPRQATPSQGDFEKVTIDDDTANPMELDVANDGRVFYIERDGEVNVWDPDTGVTSVIGSIGVTLSQENGLLGIQLAPDFDTSGLIYLAYSALPDSSNQNRVSRFEYADGQLDLASEQIVYTWQHQRQQCCHTAGSLAFAPDGTLYLSTGDNTNPFASDGYTPIDERPGRAFWDAQRTSANTNDPNGKILHIDPLDDIAPGATPGVGTTYTIPDNNLFPESEDTQGKTLPEIYAMGFRNPFRITVDPKTGWVLVGDYGPDAGQTNPNRGPQGSVEFNVVKEAGNYGWPYCVRDNVPYNDYDFATGTSGPKFDCANPVNTSPNNTGLTNLPPAIPATMWLAYTETDPRFPALGTGGAPTGGPRYDYDPDNPSLTKFPEYYDGKWFIGEWNKGWIKTADLNAAGEATDVQPFALGTGYKRPHEIEFGPDGSLYVIEWGSGFGGNNADSGIYRIDYVKGARRPIARATATPDSGPLPLEVQFSSDGSIDPDGTSITYEWDFENDGTVDSTDANPTHTYTTAGTYTATLRVTDQSGQTGVDQVSIIAGNTRPEVTIEIPEDGQFAAFGDLIPYRVTVEDPEDGTIDCSKVRVNISLGHDEHAHTLSSQQGCEGTFTTNSVSGHGPDANVFTVVEAIYTDTGGSGGAGPITGRDLHVLPLKRTQAEFYDSTGRIEGGATTGAPGVQSQTTTDVEGGRNIGYIEDGDWISFEPMNFEGISSLDFRVASGGRGGTIQVRLDAPDGPLVAETPFIAPTGGWQSWTTVNVPIPATEGTHEVFFVFRNPGEGSLMNLNWFEARGKGAAVSAAPEVTATANPTTGAAPLSVQFDGTATDPDAAAGEQLEYEWDFGVAGTDADTSTQEDPTYTYERAGTYTARLTVTDPQGASGTATVQVTVTRPPDECPTDGFVDEFDGSDLGAGWDVVRRDQNLAVSGGALRIPAQVGDIYGGRNDAKNLVVRDAPDGAWVATAKVNFNGTTQYHQAGIMVYGDDQNFTKLGRLTTSSAGAEKFEFIYENAGTPRNTGEDSTAALPAGFPDDYWVRITSDGTSITGAYSTDGSAWTPVGRPAPLPADAKIGLFAFSNNGTGNPVAAFDSFTLTGDAVGGGGGGGSAGPSYDDQFDGSTLDTERWNAIVRGDPATREVANGQLTITTEPGDIYGTPNSDPLPKNFILQSAEHAGADWVIETKLSGTIDGGYGQGGLIAYGDDGNYVKFDAISDAGNTRINRLELRSEVNGAVQGGSPADPQVPEGTTDIWLRLTKTGNEYAGAYRFGADGEWIALASPVTNPMASPDFGPFAFGPQADGVGDTVSFDSFLLDGEDPPSECECVAGPGDEFDGASLDKERWNGIVREDASKYVLEDGKLKITTVGGDIYAGGDPAATRNFILQQPASDDWVIETKVGGSISGGYEQGGLLVYQDDANYIKFDLISDEGQTVKNRIELRSEENDVVQDPQPQVTPLPAGTEEAWLRLTKEGTTYTGEYSFDGETWEALPAVQNDMAAPRHGLFTLGVNSPGGVVEFEYFSVDGSTGCPPEEPDNTAPVIESATAEPTSGFAPLEVRFDVEATDADEGDELTYSWDFNGDGTADSTDEDPTHTYAEGGTYTAEVTVSDGEAERTRTVTVTVLGADDEEARFRVLVFSKTTGFRHSSIDEGIAAIRQLGEANDFQVDATEDSTLFRDEILQRYDTVVFLSTTGDVLNDEQQAAFERYIRAGGGYTGIHSAADTEYDWTWYGELVGAYFLSHPAQQNATVRVEDRTDPSTEDLPADWPRFDEWYNYKSPDFKTVGNGDYSPRGQVHVLAALDEATYNEGDGSPEADDHPISWCQRYDGGRSWYTGMGHTEASFTEALFLQHILGGIEVAAGAAESEACGVTGGGEPGAPTVEGFADPDSGTAPLRVRFSATGLDPEGGRLTYKWEFGDGGQQYARVARHTYTEPGTYTATVTATDEDGNTATDEVEIVVSGEGLPVTADADVTSGPGPLRVRFSASSEARGVTYEWDFGDGATAFGRRAVHRYMEPGEYTATVTVTNAAGSTGTAEVTITVEDPPGNVAPSVEAAADPASGPAPLPVRFTSQGTDPDGDRLTYRWDFGDDSAAVSARNARHTYTRAGTYTATVTVTDARGATATDTVQVTVAGNRAPTVRAAADPAAGTAPLRVRFTAAGSDADGDRLSYVWDFGDGRRAGGPRAVHTYGAAGTYTATVTVTDAGGGTGSATVQVTVAAPQGSQPPPPGGGVAGERAKLRVTVDRRQDLRRVLRRGLRARVACGVQCRASAELRLGRRLARRLGLRGGARALGESRVRTVHARSGRILTVKLDRRLRRNDALLRAMRRAGVERLVTRLVVRARTAEGARTVSKRVVLVR